jgi:hypothetical protein
LAAHQSLGLDSSEEVRSGRILRVARGRGLTERQHTSPTQVPLRTQGSQSDLATINTLRSRGELSGTDSGAVKKHACWGVSTPIHSSRIGRAGKPARGASHALLYRTESLGVDSASEPSYPEGNFEGNQLLGGSIGLSPLCHAQATQFARQNSDWPPPQFPTASP